MKADCISLAQLQEDKSPSGSHGRHKNGTPFAAVAAVPLTSVLKSIPSLALHEDRTGGGPECRRTRPAAVVRRRDGKYQASPPPPLPPSLFRAQGLLILLSSPPISYFHHCELPTAGPSAVRPCCCCLAAAMMRASEPYPRRGNFLVDRNRLAAARARARCRHPCVGSGPAKRKCSSFHLPISLPHSRSRRPPALPAAAATPNRSSCTASDFLNFAPRRGRRAVGRGATGWMDRQPLAQTLKFLPRRAHFCQPVCDTPRPSEETSHFRTGERQQTSTQAWRTQFFILHSLVAQLVSQTEEDVSREIEREAAPGQVSFPRARPSRLQLLHCKVLDDLMQGCSIERKT